MVMKARALWEPPQKPCLGNRSKPGSHPDPVSIRNWRLSNRATSQKPGSLVAEPAILPAVAEFSDSPKNGLPRI